MSWLDDLHAVRRNDPSARNVLETLLCHRDAARRVLPTVLKRLHEEGVEIRGCPVTKELFTDAVAAADYVVSVLPSTRATRGMFDASLFGEFLASAFFINMGRGDLVDEAGLIEALDRGSIAGAVLDVTVEEPLPADNPLWRHPGVQITPHVSGYHLGDAIADIVENYNRLARGEPVKNRIDRELGY